MKKWLLLIVLAVAVGGGLFYWWHTSRVQALSEKTLTFAEVRQVPIRDIISATGLVEPCEIVVVSSEAPGRVVRLFKNVGDTVKEKDELASLDDRQIKLKVEEAENGIRLADAAIKQAESSVAQATSTRDAAEKYWKRQKDLSSTVGFATEREVAEAQFYAAVAGVKLANAGIELANAKKLAAVTAHREADLVHKMTSIRVPVAYRPMNGTKPREFLILERKAHEGQMVGPQSGPLFTLACTLDIVHVHAQVAEGDINKIKTNLKALFKVTNYKDEEIEIDDGKVTEIRPLATTVKGAVYYDAVIEVKNRKDPTTNEWQLRPGMTISLDIVRHEHVGAWRIPVGALNFKLEEAYQDSAARAHVAKWKERPDYADWRALWVWDATAHRAQPIFVRIVPKAGELALKDAEGNEILEWEAGKTPSGPLRVIIGAPPARAPGLLDQPVNLKI